MDAPVREDFPGLDDLGFAPPTDGLAVPLGPSELQDRVPRGRRRIHSGGGDDAASVSDDGTEFTECLSGPRDMLQADLLSRTLPWQQQLLSQHAQSLPAQQGAPLSLRHLSGRPTPRPTSLPANGFLGAPSPAAVARSLGTASAYTACTGDSDASPRRRLRRKMSAPLPLSPRDVDEHDWVGCRLEEDPMRSRALTSTHAQSRLRRVVPYWRQPQFGNVVDLYRAALMGWETDVWVAEEDEEERAMLVPSEPLEGATLGKAYVLFLKSFVAGAVLALPHAFVEGGILFTTVTSSLVSLWSCVCMHRLWRAGQHAGAMTLGEVAKYAGGRTLGACCEISLFFTQCSFCATYLVFVRQCAAQALRWFMACAGPDLADPSWALGLTAVQVVMLAPLSWVRRLEKLAFAALAADALLIVGISYLFWVDVERLAKGGAEHPAATLLGPKPGVAAGTAVFTFEGVGMVLPVAACMKDSERFPLLLVLVGGTLLLLYGSFGALGAAAFGTDTQTTVLINLNADNPASPAPALLQLAWAAAIVVTFPIQLSPAAGILERRLGISGPASVLLRTALVVALAGASLLAGPSFGVFLSFAGAFCCLPLGFIYPPLIHLLCLRKSGQSGGALVVDSALIAAGFVVFAYVVASTIQTADAVEPPLPCYYAKEPPN